MIDFSQSQIDHLSVHLVGNQDNGQFSASAESVMVDDDIKELLRRYFLKPFNNTRFFHLNTERDDSLFNTLETIFHQEGNFHEQTLALANRLWACSKHPNIKTGEFFVVLFRDCQLEDELVDAVGLFKSENKETFLKVFPENESFVVGSEQGININKLDKGALIYNSEKENGYLVQAVDQSGSEGASYWMDAFLQVEARADEFNHTHHYIQMCKDFAMEELPTESRAEKIGMVNDTIEYFNEHDHFDRAEFEQQVIREPEIIEAFDDFSKNRELSSHLNAIDDFDISAPAVRYSKRFVRSVIKLDKNFHIYVHGSRERIHKGFDQERGLHFYQVFFEEEK